LGLEPGAIFESEGGVDVEFFLESGPAEGCALTCLVGLDPGAPQNLIFVGLVGIGLCFDARAEDGLAGQTTGGELSFDAGTTQCVFSLKDGDVSAWGKDYL
jgi:hypothetical protein